MTFLDQMDPLTGLLDDTESAQTGIDLRAKYTSAQPFPYIVIDDFLPDDIAQLCLEEFASIRLHGAESGDGFDRPQERAKRQFEPEQLSAPVRQMFHAFNSRPFIRVLENITGIEGLIPDPDFLGGGLHEISTGGHLSVHADFNYHKRLNLERRINLLIYLNKDWRADYGGQLELWSKDMAQCEQSVVPTFNRAVMFNTTSTSNHGNPQPISHPSGQSRKSIALYYYTATWDGSKRERTTQFRPRPESSDATDWSVKMRELMVDILPPLVARTLRKLKK
uniref:2OG-Fe(II) oxygenase n=1 Tax=uncultured Altererythrobacter sp. TaxID=500840 RepID=UPI00260C2D08|nr:2OG-Fe(II) oxygenase [uncultured Altererythrobacter sp.]